MGLKLNATNGGGSVELDVPDTVNSDLALTVPATAGEIVVKGTDDSYDFGDVNIDSSGRLLVGTSTARTDFATTPHIQLEGDDFPTSGLSITRNSDDNGRATLFFGKSRGSSDGATDVVESGDGLGTIEFAGADGSSFVRAAHIAAQVDTTPGSNDMPGRLMFSTTVNGATSPTERMRIDSDGHVYLGDTSDYSASNYAKTSGSGTSTYRRDNGSTAGSLMLANNADRGWSLAYFNKFSWTSLKDSRYINFFKNGSSVANISLTSSGTISYATGSDYRLKENVVPLTDGITRIKQLLPKQFNMIDDPNNFVCDGFLAHEAQTVVPQAVCGTHDGMKIDEEGNETPDYQVMDYGKLTPLLTAALQEAITKIETLEAKVAALEAAE